MNLEHTFTDDPSVNRNFDRLLALMIDTGGKSVGVRFGTHTASFVAASNTGAETVTHGLGKTPEALAVFPALGAAVSMVPNYISGSRTDTTFQYRLDTKDGSVVTEDVGVFWVVIG